MKNLFTTILTTILIIISQFTLGQSTCASPITLANGACLTNQTFPGTVNMAGLCVGGNNPALYISFVAGSCSEFTLISNGNVSNIGTQILTSGCAQVGGTIVCHENVVANVPFSAGGINISGTNLLTPGTTYVMRLWGAVGTSTFSICYSANTSEAASNECGGALGLGSTPTTYYNGGDCQFSGSYNDATTTDPPANQLCAGSLENTQWVRFSPLAGVTSFQIVGANINCSGGGCGFQFGIFSGSCAGLTSEGCYGSKVCSGGQSSAGPTNTNAGDGYSITWSGTTTTGFTATITRTGGGAFLGTENFYLVMDGNADADCQYVLTGVNVQPLPIELINFSVKSTSKINRLQWETASELNNDYFIIENSTDGFVWNIIGVVNGAGNSTIKITYDFEHRNYRETVNYYRLTQVDFDGVRESFKIIAIDNSRESKTIVRTVNLMGYDVDENYKGFVINVYSDGTTNKELK